jgi:hypothetical protein
MILGNEHPPIDDNYPGKTCLLGILVWERYSQGLYYPDRCGRSREASGWEQILLCTSKCLSPNTLIACLKLRVNRVRMPSRIMLTRTHQLPPHPVVFICVPISVLLIVEIKLEVLAFQSTFCSI